MAFLDFIFGKKGKAKELPLYSPEQSQAMGQLLQLGQRQLPGIEEFLGSLIQPGSAEDRYSAPAMREFFESIIPGIAERFTGQGAQMSSAFGQQLGGAGAGLAERLAQFSQQADLQQNQQGLQAISQLLNLMQGGLGRQMEQLYKPGSAGLLGGLAPAIGLGIGGPLGGAIGGGLSKLLGGFI